MVSGFQLFACKNNSVRLLASPLDKLVRKSFRVKSLKSIKSVHGLITTMGSSLPQTDFFHNNLISAYTSLGYTSVARQVFDEMPHKNIVSYNTMISTYSRGDHVEQAWNLLSDMRSFGFVPTQFTYGSLFSCTSLHIDQGLYLQAMAMKSGLLFADTFVGTASLGFFGRQGCINEACKVFDEMPVKNLVTYNAMISLFGHEGYVNECMLMFRELLKAHTSLSETSFLGVLSGFQSKDDLDSGEQLYGLVIKFGLLSKVSVANSFVNMYGKCAEGTCLTEKMFDSVPKRDLVTWNTVIWALANGPNPIKAIGYFFKMCIDGFLPNQTTFIGAITSCTRSVEVDLTYGEFIHAKIIKNRYELDGFVGSSLVNLYAKCDRLDNARQCFDEILDKNLVSWNALLHAYSNTSSVLLLREMMQSGTSPNEFSFSSVMKTLLPLELKQVHSLVLKTGHLLNSYVSSALMTAYAKNGLTEDVLNIFNDDDKLPYSVVHSNIIGGLYNRNGLYYKTQELFSEVEDPDIVSWNILIAACSRNGDYKEAFELFHHMQVYRITPDKYTYVSLLCICTNVCNLVLGSLLHSLMIKYDFGRCDVMVCNVMMDMYGKCGSVWSAVKVFDEMPERNVISWTALVSALGLHGHGKEAVERFKQMEMDGVEPDKVAFVAVLSACRHVGLVKDGMEIFKKMKDEYAIEPEMEHYLLVVDLVARYGDLKEAEKLISGMPFAPNASIWRSFLDGCNRQRTIEHLSLQI